VFPHTRCPVPSAPCARSSPSSLLPSVGKKWTCSSSNSLLFLAGDGLGNVAAGLGKGELLLAQCNIPSYPYGAATGVTALEGFPAPGRGSGWIYRAGRDIWGSVTLTWVGGSTAPLLLPFMEGVWGQSCPRVSSQVGGQCPVLPWPSSGAAFSSGDFWEENAPAPSLPWAL